MRYIKLFENYYVDKRTASAKSPEYLTYISEPVEIRIDVEAVGHAIERQFRHGVTVGDKGNVQPSITKDEIIELIELSVEELTIALMQNKFSIDQEEDNYPTRGVRAGEPNRFVLRNKKTNLNLVCMMKSGDNEFTLTVITAMKTIDFRTYNGQYVIEV